MAKRALAFSPLLLAGLAIAWSFLERLQGLPCPEDRTARAVDLGASGLFALYFLAAYVLALRRQWLVLGVATLWAWQLLVLWPLAAPACAGFGGRDPAAQAFAVRFAWLAAAIAVLALLTTWAMAWRWRSAPSLPPGARRTGLLRLLAGATLVFVMVAAGATVATTSFRELYAAFGADLPWPTLLLFEIHGWSGLVAVPVMAAFLYAAGRSGWSERALDGGLDCATALLVAANLVLGGLVFALYAPALKLCSCV
jgi:hypothetical protein